MKTVDWGRLAERHKLPKDMQENLCHLQTAWLGLIALQDEQMVTAIRSGDWSAIARAVSLVSASNGAVRDARGSSTVSDSLFSEIWAAKERGDEPGSAWHRKGRKPSGPVVGPDGYPYSWSDEDKHEWEMRGYAFELSHDDWGDRDPDPDPGSRQVNYWRG